MTAPSAAPRNPLARLRTLGAGLAATSALAAGLVTAAAPDAGAIVFGRPAEPVPWIVQITTFHNVPGTPCTGVVVDPFWVATAGHCGPDDPRAYTLGFGNLGALPAGMGAPLLASPGSVEGLGPGAGLVNRVVPVAAVHSPGADVMMLKLAAPAPAPPVLRAGVDPAPGSILRTYGFGEISPGGLRSPVALTGLTRVDRVEPRGASRIGRGHTVEGGYGFGDSGGPVFQGDRLVGLHSGSDHAARQPDGTNPAWFESVPAQNAWIDGVIRRG